METILSQTRPEDNSLLAPVHVAEDPNAVLKSDHPSADILAQPGIVVQRQIEMMNLFLGFEQANRYVILDPNGAHIGYMAEHDGGLGKAMARQWLRTHRPFTTHVFDKHGREVLRFHRPFSWFVSRIRVYDPLTAQVTSERSSPAPQDPSVPDTMSSLQQISHVPIESMRVIGEAVSEWAPLRRKYNLFVHPRNAAGPEAAAPRQFAAVNEPFLSWDFSLIDPNSRLIGSVNRSFRGLGREIFTDTGSYVIRMDAAGSETDTQQDDVGDQSGNEPQAYSEALGSKNGMAGMSLDERACVLATAVTLDYDYFSRHSSFGGSGGFLPLWMGGGEAAGGAAGGAAGAGEAAGGAVVGGAGRAVGVGAAPGGIGESAAVGAGTMAGYEAMQRGLGRDSQPDSDPASPPGEPQGGPYNSQSPQSQPEAEHQASSQPFDSPSHQGEPGHENHADDVWGQGSDPWSDGAGQGPATGGNEGGFFSSLWDSFFGD
ncbi:hypothetical protein PV08_08683 [Exophiala spinifera]|uniref:Phospholipid scramblase n=1 Tax=Exophiala spinifera TaxID=91928 RepID=A0A0D2B498_9EURO|nr:uncharacterized protein PV08_08683 [Exophiala spinifera]KIW13495.1 hypothetical protein PV08_08683 [Exophiala spinifera]